MLKSSRCDTSTDVGGCPGMLSVELATSMDPDTSTNLQNSGVIPGLD